MYILYSFVHYIRLPVGTYRPFQFSIQHRCQNQFTSARTIIIIELDSSLAITNCDSKESRCRMGPNLISKRRWDNGWQNKCRKWKMARGRLSLDPTVGRCQANCAYIFCQLQLTAKIYIIFILVLSTLVWCCATVPPFGSKMALINKHQQQQQQEQKQFVVRLPVETTCLSSLELWFNAQLWPMLQQLWKCLLPENVQLQWWILGYL